MARVRGGAGEYEGKRGDVGKRGRARKLRERERVAGEEVRVAGEDVRGPYSLGNREEGARGWSGGEPGKRGRGRGGLWGCVGEDAGKRGRAWKMRERM